MKRFCFAIGVVLSLSAVAAADTPLTHVRIEWPDAPALADELNAAGWDVLEGSVTPTSLDLIVTAAEHDFLVASGYFPIVLAHSRPFEEIQREMDIPPGYLNLTEIVAEINAKAAAYPSICKVVDLTVAYNMPATFEGRHLYAVKISDNVDQDEDEPSLMLVSNHHAREIVTPVIALHAINQLTSQYGSNPTITNHVNNYEIWIATVWNPDGYTYVFTTNNMWRKNRFVFAGGIGCDQNHNYPLGWTASCSGSTSASSDTYKGPSPASEIETQTMIAWANDRHFTKMIDFHSYGRVALYGYRCSPHPLMNFLRSEAQAFSSAAGYGGSASTPSAEGEDPEWHGGLHGTHAFLLETATSFQPSYATAQSEATMVWPGILWMLNRAIPLTGHVTAAPGGAPLEATITINGLTYSMGEVHKSHPRFGRYHLFLPAGNYTINFSATGYVTRSFPVTITASTQQVLDVQLSPPYIIGDLNCDSLVNFDDINPFVLALTGQAAYEAMYPNCRWMNADVNNDGVVDFYDINAFVELLTG